MIFGNLIMKIIIYKMLLNYQRNYLNQIPMMVSRLSVFGRSLHLQSIILAEHLRQWIPDVTRLVECWEQRSFGDLDEFYNKLLDDPNSSDQIDALLRFLYDIQSYEMVQYLLEKNVQHYKQGKTVSSSMTGFHEACVYGFSQVCSLYIRDRHDINEPFSLIYTHCKTNKKELIRNLTGLQLVCLWSKYFPKRLVSYAHTVRILLNHGARVNMTSTELTTALHWACRAQHTAQLAQDLINAGACIDARDRINIRPMHYACWARNRLVVEILLKKGGRLTDQDDLGRTPVHFLCMPKYAEAICTTDQQEQVELMRYLLEYHQKYPYVIDFIQMDHHGYTFLAYGCISHNLPLIELLLQYQPDLLNQPTIEGQTPLMISINEGFSDGVEYFLRQKNLQRNIGDHLGNTAIHHACLASKLPSRLNILRVVLEDQNGQFDLEKRNGQLHDPLMISIINQNIDACRLLIEHNVSVTKTDLHSRQSLHIACQLGNYELVALLLKSPQININAVDDCHRNCLFYAISSGHVGLVQLLIDNRIVIQIRDIVGDTPLHLAVQQTNNACEITRILLSTDAGQSLINLGAADGMEPLLLAAQNKQADVIHLLLKNGANTKAVDLEHHTALHLACRSACMTSAFYLIELAEFDVNALDCYRQSPIFYAFASHDYDLVQYLISCGAQFHLRDSQNYLPLHIGIISSENEDEFNLKLIDIYNDQYESLLDDQNNECQMTPLILAAMQGRFNVVQHLVLRAKVNIMATCSNGHTALHYACLMKTEHSLDIVQFLIEHGCTYEKVDQPKGSFLYTIVQYGDRQAMRFFMDYSLVNLMKFSIK